MNNSKSEQIDTSIYGFRHVGINLTDKQYDDLRDLNTLILCNEHRQRIPVFNILIVLRILGLLPEEMLCEPGSGHPVKYTGEITRELVEQKFGRYRTKEVNDMLEALFLSE